VGVRLRTTLTATAAVAVALGLASFALFAALHASLEDTAKDLALKDAQARAARQFAGLPGAPPLPGGAGASGGGPASEGDSASGGGSASSQAGRAGGAGQAGQAGQTGGPGEPGRVVTTPGVAGTSFATDDGGGHLVVTQTYTTDRGPVTVVGSASTEPAKAAMDTLTGVLLPGAPALLAFVALLTWLAVGRALRPVSAIRAKVAEITAHGLHERVPVPATRDEVALLARTVNDTLDRLRTAVDAHRQFVADAAHELRSPMAILRTRLELAAPAERRLAAEALDDVDRLGALTADLLLLARLDARQPLRLRDVDLGQVVAEEAARRRPRAEVAVLLDLVPDLLVLGSAEHLRRMVANLVDNAVRHAAGTVRVTLSRTRGGGVVLDVRDDGPGIADEHRDVVFQRFTRLDHARTRDTGGSGLGLPIARDIARSHGGDIALGQSPMGGLRVTVTIPA
jgi:signal transduction histidine kinase